MLGALFSFVLSVKGHKRLGQDAGPIFSESRLQDVTGTAKSTRLVRMLDRAANRDFAYLLVFLGGYRSPRLVLVDCRTGGPHFWHPSLSGPAAEAKGPGIAIMARPPKAIILAAGQGRRLLPHTKQPAQVPARCRRQDHPRTPGRSAAVCGSVSRSVW